MVGEVANPAPDAAGTPATTYQVYLLPWQNLSQGSRREGWRQGARSCRECCLLWVIIGRNRGCRLLFGDVQGYQSHIMHVFKSTRDASLHSRLPPWVGSFEADQQVVCHLIRSQFHKVGLAAVSGKLGVRRM